MLSNCFYFLVENKMILCWQETPCRGCGWCWGGGTTGSPWGVRLSTPPSPPSWTSRHSSTFNVRSFSYSHKSLTFILFDNVKNTVAILAATNTSTVYRFNIILLRIFLFSSCIWRALHKINLNGKCSHNSKLYILCEKHVYCI